MIGFGFVLNLDFSRSLVITIKGGAIFGWVKPVNPIFLRD
jgi:hypothetical protein